MTRDGGEKRRLLSLLSTPAQGFGVSTIILSWMHLNLPANLCRLCPPEDLKCKGGLWAQLEAEHHPQEYPCRRRWRDGKISQLFCRKACDKAVSVGIVFILTDNSFTAVIQEAIGKQEPWLQMAWRRLLSFCIQMFYNRCTSTYILKNKKGIRLTTLF